MTPSIPMTQDFEVDKEKDLKDNKQEKGSFKLLLKKIIKTSIMILTTKMANNKNNLENT